VVHASARVAFDREAKASNDPLDEPLRALDWWYPEDELGEPQMETVLAEIQRAGTPILSLTADGIVFGLDPMKVSSRPQNKMVSLN